MAHEIIPIIENYNVEEEFLYNKTYLFIKGYATARGLKYTLKALPLARVFHNGQHRKGQVEIKGEKYQLPYVLHCLKVCATLISLNLKDILTPEEEDILLAASIGHDFFEDCKQYFPKGGIELVQDYGFPMEVYEIIKLLSKESGAEEWEISEYFNKIKKNCFASLIKVADRSHNVEDLYNMKIEKLHKYTKETRNYIYDLCSYCKANYPELSNAFTILKSKILSLTELTEALVEMYDEIIAEKDKEIKKLKEDIRTTNIRAFGSEDN